MDFPGIPAESLFLLAENRFQDSKAFYEEHKPQINKTVVHPLKQLVKRLSRRTRLTEPPISGSTASMAGVI